MTTVSHPGDALSRGRRILYVVALGALVALGPFTIDLYLPSFPRVAAEFHAPDSQIQLTLTATTVGFGLGQLLVGPLSDRVGRRVPLLLATALHVVASVAVALAPSVPLLIALRVVQGVGAAGGGVVAMAMVRDLFGGQPLIRMLSRLALVSGLAPILAPVIGSQLLAVLDWRGVFWCLAGYGAVILLTAIVLVRETLPAELRHMSGHATTRQRYAALFHDRVFIGVAFIGGMTFSGVFTYLSASPFIFQDGYHLSAQEFGLVFGINSVGLVVASQSASRIMRRVAPSRILVVSLPLILLAAGALVLDGLGDPPLLAVAIPFFVLVTSAGLTFPTVQVLALAGHGREAGTAASLLGAANFGLAGAVSPVVGLIGVTPANTGIVIAATSVVALASLWILVRPLRHGVVSDDTGSVEVPGAV
ncbi:multidrug effflux MFS transporter [Pseudolysinimonas kribbensis]|uniref:Bcr/CflA family drug resistance efflux transporter n=1 Tax=Pseudolysinimonas kribbensis TaxID=433641 RepID=A0ABQ6K1D0_9MICO|nr:multidrug effflux MFS transporter [Pseudolysinimonas kribbensis]GMA94410.1 Bcr/CflA family drug resistance efflux transporter [Pseudolysinimonas kribbensis]